MERMIIVALSLALAFVLGALAGGGPRSASAAAVSEPKCFVLPEWKPNTRKWADSVEKTVGDLHARGPVRQVLVATPAAQGSAMGEGGLIIVCATYE